MDPRFVTKNIHALLDYPVALMLLGAPWVLGLGASSPLALWLGVLTGVAALFLTIFTDHFLGLVRVLPYWFHVLVDGLVGVTFVAAPFVLGFEGLDAWFYWVNGLAVLTVVSLSKPERVGSPALA
ncbi:MAG: hypothetical protein ACF8GE_07835 [Phycisphaerales bacterium JB043]